MSNHIHLLLRQDGDSELGDFFRRLGSGYVGWYNNRHDRVGHLFQARFASEAIEDEATIPIVARYIHLNPVAAGMCRDPAEYPYSSYRLYLDRCHGISETGIVDTGILLDLVPPGSLVEFHHDKSSVYADPYCSSCGFVRMSDERARVIVRECGGGSSSAEFRELSRDRKRSVLAKCVEAGLPYRQISRLTGSSYKAIKRAIER